jgi:hypothetical protein
MLIPTTNSSQIRRYRSPNFDCQSNPGVSIQSSSGFGCDCHGRPAAGRRRRVATRWQPYAGRGPIGQSMGPSRPPRRTGAAPILSPSLIRLRHRETELPLPPPLRRARARSPPHRSPPKFIHYSANIPSTSFTRCLTRLCRSEGEFRFLPPRVLAGVLSAQRLTMPSSLRSPSSLPATCSGFRGG